jgi:hypothetical protein
MTDEPEEKRQYRYAVCTLNGFSFMALSTFGWADFVRAIRSDGFLITETVYIPAHAIGHIAVMPEAAATDGSKVVSLRPVE